MQSVIIAAKGTENDIYSIISPGRGSVPVISIARLYRTFHDLLMPHLRPSLNLKTLSRPRTSSWVANDHVGSVKEFSAPALPPDCASEPAQYDASEPVSTPSATTADPSYVAPGTTDAERFL